MSEQLKAVVTVGVSASGKSTFAEEWVKKGIDHSRMIPSGNGHPCSRFEINRDAIRRSLVEKTGKKFSWKSWNWKREKEVTAIQEQMVVDAAKNGLDVIVSDTNLGASTRKRVVEMLENAGYSVEVKDFPVTLEEAWTRDAARADGVGASVIANQYKQWLDYIGRRKYVPDTSKPRCILVDIDGTLAHMNGKRGAFDWNKVGLDDVDDAVRMMCYMTKFAYQQGHFVDLKVIVLSGRDGVCRPETEDWLVRNGVVHDRLIMRAPGDMRKDTVVKEEIFWRDIAENYNVMFAIDDRPSVCRMWREIGLKTFQVGDPHVEF